MGMQRNAPWSPSPAKTQLLAAAYQSRNATADTLGACKLRELSSDGEGKINVKGKVRTHRREDDFLPKTYMQSRNFSLFEPKNMRKKVVMCFSFITIENRSKCSYKE